MLSPILMHNAPPDLKVCFISNGSRAASNSSSMFSNNTGCPNCTAFSRTLMYPGCVSLTTCKLDAFSIFFTHLFAWLCGSIISGQRREFVTIMALSIENRSFGRPNIFQARICTGSPNTCVSWKSCVQTTFRSVQNSTQFSICRCRYCIVKTPR